MRIFNEEKTKELINPDLTLGYTRSEKLLLAHHAAQEEVRQQSHYEVVAEYPNGGKDLREVIDVEYQPASAAWDEYEDILVYIPYTQAQIDENLNREYIPSEQESLVAVGKMFLMTMSVTDAETKLSVSGLYDTWTAGKYEVGDIRNHGGQTWECIQAHDNAVYPDITPDNLQTWHTFWKPLHGKSAETARPWVKPQFGTTDMYHAGEYMIYTDGKKQFGTTDMYLAGEYMIYTDGKRYKCLSDTVYSPEEYAQAWEVQS